MAEQQLSHNQQQQQQQQQQPQQRNRDAELAETSSGAPVPGFYSRNQQQPYSMADFVSKVEDFKSTIPDSVTNHYLQQAGFDCNDPKMFVFFFFANIFL